ncbi:hypothetical protein SCHPADRAFT_646648 [Schizopora paradoxa]|uniref:DUF6533 domain-containing protein n=1 Tax=Schizopora paradoxa TaxID=27342 RepID=A0A0H2RRS1_9AGAM|nr:hypothetical protein SCHPADRAFT_646648 [Schizopora paradoxa]
MSFSMEIDTLTSLISQKVRADYVCVSALAFVLYDFALTSLLEYHLVWKDSRSLSLQKLLYFVCRFGVVVDAILLVAREFTSEIRLHAFTVYTRLVHLVMFPQANHSTSWVRPFPSCFF